MTEQFDILLLEDDNALAMGLIYSLQKEGYIVNRICSYKEGLNYMHSHTGWDRTLGIFDVMLPDGNGITLLETYRENGINFPVIFLSALSDEINIVQGLDIGGDDYITKPFKVKELLSRIKAVIRRYYNASFENPVQGIRYKNLFIDESTATVSIITSEYEKNTLDLTANEYRLLLFFIHNQGTLLTRELLLQRLYDNHGSFVDDNTLSVYIRRIREKLGENRDIIKTVHGMGYIMEKENA